MSRSMSLRVQAAVVLVLVLGSVCVLLANTFSALSLSRSEPAQRARLREAGRRLADAADGPSGDRELAAVASRALADQPGVEGGFYVAAEDRFAAYSFPTGGAGEGPPPAGADPPPLEAPFIRALARQSLALPEGESTVRVADVGPSRVIFLARPVGRQRPARLVAWVMVRVSGPPQLEASARRYAVSTGLALASVSLALLLSWNLGRTLRRQRQEQERLRDELRRAEHLASLGRLLAGVAHEVRNPLAGIRSTVQLWQRLPDVTRTPESMDAVVASVDRLDGLVARLLHFARPDASEREPVDVNRAAAESLDLLAAQAAGQGVTLERDLAADLPPVAGSADGLRQVVLNLLTNALQAMPTGGKLRCSAALSGKWVELRVTDTGHGVAGADQPRLFEPFFTTRPDGTGLGLALCREIVAGHGGRIELESTGPGGSVFLVALPALA